MSAKGKLEKFAELSTFGNVFQNFSARHPKLIAHDGTVIANAGRWNKLYFKREARIVVELACGKGEYTINLAEHFPDNNYIGVDIKGNRIWKGAKYAWKQKLQNVAFVRTPIDQMPLWFGRDEVDEIWITFPDPHLRKSKSQQRLTSQRFLKTYGAYLKPNGKIHLKTDSEPLFEFTKEVVTELELPIERLVEDVYKEAPNDLVLTIQTFYEKMHLEEGRTIRYIQFRLKP